MKSASSTPSLKSLERVHSVRNIPRIPSAKSFEKLGAAATAGRNRPMFARRGIVTFGAISLLLIFFIGEVSLQKLMLLNTWSLQTLQSSYCNCQFETDDSVASSVKDQSSRNHTFLRPPRIIRNYPTVREAFVDKVKNISSFSSRTSKHIKTSIDKNTNVLQFGLTTVRKVCMRPDGAIVMVGMTEDEIRRKVSEVPALEKEWLSSYNCSTQDGCVGFERMAIKNLPSNVTWVSGTTVHILPYLENVFHHFADRLWPHVAGHEYPLNRTTPHPIDHFLVHRFSTWLAQAQHNMDRNTLMYQIRILGRLSHKADFLVVDGLRPQDLVCYESLTLACATCDRVSDKLGSNITRPALLAYRKAAFNYFRMREPRVVIPPRPLRVTFYGRRDTKRRRILNSQEVVDHLRNWISPPLDVVFLDELMANGVYNQSLPEVVSLYSETDILITPHGANTWAALFMPKHAAVIEIYGPCGPSTWISTIADAVELKHSTESNPYGLAVASPLAGNTTECKGPYETPDFTIDVPKLDRAIHELALPVFGSKERISRHWLHDWSGIIEELQQQREPQIHISKPHDRAA